MLKTRISTACHTSNIFTPWSLYRYRKLPILKRDHWLIRTAASYLVCGNPEAVNENPRDDDAGKRRPPVLGLTPLELPDVSFIIKERMSWTLRYFKESTKQHQILPQVWAPVRSGNQYVTTSGQPFVFGPQSNGLHQYRTVSLMNMFSVDGECDGPLGLPGRVFSQKLLEWTPNVQYYSSKE
ncbi:hypothetical protein Nepgr_017344 [Nepenthes gracilis]|uniref:Uncharacterized protein n=1 Tax=Nepenthes gracilis TaxID=150966 RepID=A0AAD3SQ86_NEPGR|nr:hypothetical protein Nepgr_017344 [Nepenthes gracilis]